ncbi:hypothetical protein [Celeribacter sp.]|uniref:hypothetical protein n=1 Tax=Celeribacter sp. TaxID=1890673 RepID=UPI003A93E24A
MQTHRTHTRLGPDAPLIFGLDPLNIDHAKIIVQNGTEQPRGRVAVAWRTIMEANGTRLDGDKLRQAFGLRLQSEVAQ